MKLFFKSNYNKIVLLCFIFFITIIQYLPIILHHQEIIFPQGGDAANHLWMTKTIIENGTYQGILYPNSFHILQGVLYFVTGLSIIKLFIYFTPFIFILALLSIYLLTRKFINEKTAIFAIFILSLISYHPQWYLRDATVVNVLAVFFFMPLVILYLYKFIIAGKISNLIISAIFFLNNGILHTVGFLHSFVIILGSLFFILTLLRNINKKKVIVVFLIFLILGILNPYKIITSYFAPIFLKNVKQQTEIQNIQKEDAISGVPIIPPKNFDEFLKHTNKFIWIIFIFSIPFIYRYYRISGKKVIFLILLFGFIFLFLGSRVKFGVETERFTRDFTLMLLIFSSFFTMIIRHSYYKKFILFVFLLISIILYVPKAIANYAIYTPELKYIDYQVIIWLNNKYPGISKNILLSPTLMGDQIPGPFVLMFADKNINFKSSACFSDILYKPNLRQSQQFYRKNDIDFIYYRNKPLGWIPMQCDFKFDKPLESANFLKKINTFKDDSVIIKIFQVDKNKL